MIQSALKPKTRSPMVTPLTNEQRELLDGDPKLLGLLLGRAFGSLGWARSGDDIAADAVVQVAMRSAQWWRPDGGASFRSFATTNVDYALRTVRAKIGKRMATQPLRLRNLDLDLDLDLDSYVHASFLPREQPSEILVAREDEANATERLAALPPRIRRVLELRYGITGEPLRIDEAAARLGVTRDKVRVLETEGLRRLGAVRLPEASEPHTHTHTHTPQGEGRGGERGCCSGPDPADDEDPLLPRDRRAALVRVLRRGALPHAAAEAVRRRRLSLLVRRVPRPHREDGADPRAAAVHLRGALREVRRGAHTRRRRGAGGARSSRAKRNGGR